MTDLPYKFGFIVASNQPIEVFDNADLPPGAGDPMPVNESGGDIASIPPITGDTVLSEKNFTFVYKGKA